MQSWRAVPCRYTIDIHIWAKHVNQQNLFQVLEASIHKWFLCHIHTRVALLQFSLKVRTWLHDTVTFPPIHTLEPQLSWHVLVNIVFKCKICWEINLERQHLQETTHLYVFFKRKSENILSVRSLEATASLFSGRGLHDLVLHIVCW